MEDTLCSKWNGFQENMGTSFGRLRGTSNFSDVTLVCEDGEQIDLHQIVLAAFSPFLEKLLERKDHPHPLFNMRGITKADLGGIFLYYFLYNLYYFLFCGEVNILQENVESFLAIADQLKVKGLQPNKKETKKQVQKEMARNLTKSKPKPPSKRKEKQGNVSTDIKYETVPDSSRYEQTNDYSDQLQKHKEKVNSMQEKSENNISNEPYNLHAYSCKVCGKEGVQKNIESHIEVHHMENIVLDCPLCKKNFSSMTALW